MEQSALKNVNNCFKTNFYSCLDSSVGKSYNLYLNTAHCSTAVLIRHPWQLKTVVFLNWCLISSVLLGVNQLIQKMPNSEELFARQPTKLIFAKKFKVHF